MKTTTAVGVLCLFAFVLLAGWWVYGNKITTTPAPADDTVGSIGRAAFACNLGKSVGTVFYNGSVALTLSDGRTQTLPQVEAASGIRYANADQSLIFWGKGNTAFITEGAEQTQTYTGCIVVAPDPTGTLTQILATSSELALTIRFPQNYTVDQAYKYEGLGPGKLIKGVKMTVPAAATAGTNLSKDTYISVEILPKATTCSASLFLDTKKTITFSDNGIDYSVATGTDAGAGNIYDEAVFAIPDSSSCTAVRYFIHSTNVGNYPAGTVKEFDKAGVIAEFDNIRRSLVLGR
ncbi:MAG: Protein of unknown function DUF2091, periplasmic [Parcubacteria group bacterium Gr01-1014_56]|nr:MAG: Protein of unknown function DUF2091, periplasmic [Parcubacteria group bacterium Gr01-1014_56]